MPRSNGPPPPPAPVPLPKQMPRGEREPQLAPAPKHGWFKHDDYYNTDGKDGYSKDGYADQRYSKGGAQCDSDQQ